VARWVEELEETFVGREKGWLWIHHAPEGW
jgi:hypothetical protein